MAQLVWQVSTMLERLLSDQSKRQKNIEPKGPLQISWKDRKTIFDENLDLHLAEYTLASVQVSHPHNTFFMATDKGSINSLSLQVSVVTLPSEHALVCVPQVPRTPSLP